MVDEYGIDETYEAMMADSPENYPPRTSDYRVSHLTDEELLEEYAHLKELVESLQGQLGRCEQEIYRRLDERGSKAITDGQGNEFYTKDTYEYDQSKLESIKEDLTPGQLAICWKPERVRVVTDPAEFDVTKLKYVANHYHGKEMLERIEAARVRTRRSPGFKKKE